MIDRGTRRGDFPPRRGEKQIGLEGPAGALRTYITIFFCGAN
jgi:hypothetical protein